MRSQLDCIDNRLPGTGVFDLKTRAAVPIRLDMLNYEVHLFSPYDANVYTYLILFTRKTLVI